MSALIGLGLGAFGGFLVIAGLRRLLTAVSLHRNEATLVRNVAGSEGPVEFDGRAEPRAEDGALEAPFSGETALCCEVWMKTKSRHRTDADGVEPLGPESPEKQRNTDQSWLLAESGAFRRPFVVQDGGTRVEVDPEEADLDITGHMGESVLTVGSDEPLPDDVLERLRALERTGVALDCAPETWDREEDRVQYREARLEPGDAVHVAGGTVESEPEEWGSGITATIGASETADRFLISEGTESTVVREHLIQFATGVTVGLTLFGLGLHASGITGAI